MEMNDLMALKALGTDKMSPYEQYMMGYKQQKAHTSGTAVAGLVTGVVGTVAGITAWIFGGMYANAKSNQAKEAAAAAKEIAGVQFAANQRQLDQLTSLLGAERAERIAGDINLTNTVTDSVSGSQQGTLTAQQAAELSSIQSVQQNLFNQAVMGNLSENPQKVMLYSAPQPCGCPGCGCNG